MLRTLRQSRYLALGFIMLIVAGICIAAGTWQIYRFNDKVHENDVLRANARFASVPAPKILPVLGGPSRSAYDYEYRTVTVTGRYDVAHQTLARNRTVGGVTGYLAVTPLKTDGPTLLVVRGFAGPNVNGHPPRPTPPPSGVVTVTARAEPTETREDEFASLSDGQVESINPRDQQARIGGTLYDAYAQLLPHQPGAAGLKALGAPNLSNPAGGAIEPQHFAYIIQWYLFAILAVAAPFAMARAETKHRREDEIDIAPAVDPQLSAEERRSAKLADRYGRPVR